MIEIILSEIVILLVNLYMMFLVIQKTRREMQYRKVTVFSKAHSEEEKFHSFNSSVDNFIYCLVLFCVVALIAFGLLQCVLFFGEDYDNLVKIGLFVLILLSIDVAIYYLMLLDSNVSRILEQLLNYLSIFFGVIISFIGIVILGYALVLPIILYGISAADSGSLGYIVALLLETILVSTLVGIVSSACLSHYFTKSNSLWLRGIAYMPAIGYLFLMILCLSKVNNGVSGVGLQTILLLGSLLNGMMIAPEISIYFNSLRETDSLQFKAIIIYTTIRTAQASIKFSIINVLLSNYLIEYRSLVTENSLLVLLHNMLNNRTAMSFILSLVSIGTVIFILLEIVKFIIQKNIFIDNPIVRTTDD